MIRYTTHITIPEIYFEVFDSVQNKYSVLYGPLHSAVPQLILNLNLFIDNIPMVKYVDIRSL